jgi:hypothetical protein
MQAFFKAVRGSLFGGRMSQGQVEGLDKIVKYGIANGYSRPDLAYVLATVHHETGRRMQPIREGFASTDAGSRRAVASLKAKGIIRTNYALPTGPYKQSYYGRSLVQITWLENYVKFGKLLGIPLEQYPDLALEWPHALDILFIGMRDGLFTKYSLKEVPDVMKSPGFDNTDRLIINGDARKNGPIVSAQAASYWNALESVYDGKDVQAGDSGADVPVSGWGVQLCNLARKLV